MYESIRFEGLRALDHVELTGLRRVNLIVGKNNVGKTTVLEGLLLLGGATNPAMLLTLGQMRGQRLDRARPEPEPIWRSFSHAFQDDRIVRITGQWGGESNERALAITRLVTRALADTDEDPTVARAFGETRLNGVTFEYRGSSAAPVRTSATLEGGELRNHNRPQRTDFVRTALVSARARTLERVAEQYGYLLRMKKEGPVLEALQLLDGRIQRLEIVHESGAPAVYCDLGFPALAPLAVCGDGVVRLFSFVVELTAVKGGVLLIDEIDAGLHYSVMVPFWRTLRQLADAHDVQIFATTHNDDLLRSALEAFGDDLSWFRLYRLDRRKQGIVAVTYDDEALAAARDERIEVRG
jgi:predicted ATPase